MSVSKFGRIKFPTPEECEQRERLIHQSVCFKLDELGIEYVIETNHPWKWVTVFELKGNKVQCAGLKRNGELDIYYYTQEYAADLCRIKPVQ